MKGTITIFLVAFMFVCFIAQNATAQSRIEFDGWLDGSYHLDDLKQGIACVDKGRYREALTFLNNIDSEDKDYVRVLSYVYKAKCYENLRDFSKAHLCFNQAIDYPVDLFTINKDVIRDAKHTAYRYDVRLTTYEKQHKEQEDANANFSFVIYGIAVVVIVAVAIWFFKKRKNKRLNSTIPDEPLKNANEFYPKL